MHLTFRFVVPLLAALALIAYAIIPLVDRLITNWFLLDLDSRGTMIVGAIKEEFQQRVAEGDKAAIKKLLTNITQDEKLFALGYCETENSPPLTTKKFPSNFNCQKATALKGEDSEQQKVGDVMLHIVAYSLPELNQSLGALVLMQDMTFVLHRTKKTRLYVLYLFLALGLVVSAITVVIAQLSWRGWLSGVRSLLKGEKSIDSSARAVMPELDTLEQNFHEVMHEVRAQHGPRDESQLTWTPNTLRTILRTELRGEDIIVISNREPYIHIRGDGDEIEVQQPASGLVTALEPVMRACSGTWIAHGGGNADRQAVDERDGVAVPPDNPTYRLRRIWLSAEEEQGYYYGFSNEGLWPLCHIAHVRPIFRAEDWKHYVEINQRFADAAVAESKTSNPIILVQDYHLALVPRMIRKQLPDATIITFWHIPWPNPESFAICPWRKELLEGMLGSSILGFHTQFHCNNFLDTVDRLLEARVDRESFTVNFGGQATAVKRYPISIEWPTGNENKAKTIQECRSAVRTRWLLPPDHFVGIGVDRMDYTKGILERLRAVERLMELYPQWLGHFTFIQIAAPSRSTIPEYQFFEKQVLDLTNTINARFAGKGPPPIILIARHHRPSLVYEYYRAADVCFISSLHDGMNLVAKEFIACRDDDHGVLVLSQFTGAARELPEALIVNPYDADQCAAALHTALQMPHDEQRARIRLMRGLIREFNVYRWAGRMLLDAASMRIHGRFIVGAEGPTNVDVPPPLPTPDLKNVAKVN